MVGLHVQVKGLHRQRVGHWSERDTRIVITPIRVWFNVQIQLDISAERSRIIMKHQLLILVTIASCIQVNGSMALGSDGWLQLFNGRDLTGWKANVHPDSFCVVEGAIRAHCTSDRHRSHLFYVGNSDQLVRFKNFELLSVFRGEPSSNSGIFFHTDMSTRDARLHLAKGYELNLNNSAREKQKTGSLYAVVGVNEPSIDDTQWTTIHLTVRDRRIVVRLNGKKVVDYTEPAAVQRPPSRSGRLIDPDGGAIALQAHDPRSVYYFKEVRIRKLP